MVPNPMKKIGYTALAVFGLKNLDRDCIIGLPYFLADISNLLDPIKSPVDKSRE